MVIKLEEMEAIKGKLVYVFEKSTRDRPVFGQLAETPSSEGNKWRYPYSVVFVKKSASAVDSPLSDMIGYLPIPHERSQMTVQEEKIFIEADVLSHPTIMMEGNPEHAKYRKMLGLK